MESRKLSLIEYLTKLDDEALLLQIENLIKSSNDFWTELSEEGKSKIKKGIEQHKKGDRVEFNDFMKKLRDERK